MVGANWHRDEHGPLPIKARKPRIWPPPRSRRRRPVPPEPPGTRPRKRNRRRHWVSSAAGVEGSEDRRVWRQPRRSKGDTKVNGHPSPGHNEPQDRLADEHPPDDSAPTASTRPLPTQLHPPCQSPVCSPCNRLHLPDLPCPTPTLPPPRYPCTHRHAWAHTRQFELVGRGSGVQRKARDPTSSSSPGVAPTQHPQAGRRPVRA